MAVVDASVQVALVNDADAHHAIAMGWYRKALTAGETITAPWLLVAEVSAALSRGMGNPGLAERAVAELVAQAQVSFVVVDEQLAAHAAQLAAQCGLRGCDSIYVALAASLDEPLVTLDQDQAQRAAAATTVIQPGGG